MSKRPRGHLTRRDVAASLAMLGASALGLRASVEAATTPRAIPIPRPRPQQGEPDPNAAPDISTNPPANASKAWLTLPPTPSLPKPERSEVITVNGVPIYFAQFGKGFGKGPAVLMLHGGLGSSNYWGHQVRALADNFSVTVMDTRGHGRSPLTSRKFGYDVFAADVAGLLAALGIPSTAIIGWSDGAITGLQLAMMRPHLVTKLFAFGANSNLSGLKPGGAKTKVFASYTARSKVEYAQLSAHPERWSQLTGDLGLMWRAQPNFTKQQLATIASPTVISDGEYDEIIKTEHTAQIARDIPNARLMVQPAVSHFAMLQNPAQFNRALLEFLSDAK